MKRFTQTTANYFRYVNIERARMFTLAIGSLCCILAFVVDPLIFDDTFVSFEEIQLSHITITVLSFLTYFLIRKPGSINQANKILMLYLVLLAGIETYISGAIDTFDNRGPTIYIATMFIIGFLFRYSNLYFIIWFIANYIFFVVLVILHATDSNHLIQSIGNGTVFALLIFVMRIYTHKRRIEEHNNQKKLIEYISKSKKEKTVPKKDMGQNNELLILLTEFIVEKKNFLDVDLSLSKVAQELETNTKYLSQLINSTYNKNFNVYINELRVLEAKKIMCHKLGEVITIEAISQQAGFKSKSSFYTAFKNYTGLTPADFLKQNSNNRRKSCPDS